MLLKCDINILLQPLWTAFNLRSPSSCPDQFLTSILKWTDHSPETNRHSDTGKFLWHLTSEMLYSCTFPRPPPERVWTSHRDTLSTAVFIGATDVNTKGLREKKRTVREIARDATVKCLNCFNCIVFDPLGAERYVFLNVVKHCTAKKREQQSRIEWNFFLFVYSAFKQWTWSLSSLAWAYISVI